jgi:hypothetical protein
MTRLTGSRCAYGLRTSFGGPIPNIGVHVTLTGAVVSMQTQAALTPALIQNAARQGPTGRTHGGSAGRAFPPQQAAPLAQPAELASAQATMPTIPDPPMTQGEMTVRTSYQRSGNARPAPLVGVNAPRRASYDARTNTPWSARAGYARPRPWPKI